MASATAPEPVEVPYFEVELTQQERMQLISILPQVGDLALVRKVRLLRDSVNLKADERPKPQTSPGMPMVQQQPIPPKKFSFSRSTTELIVDQLEQLDKARKLPVEYLDLYDKFMEDKKDVQ